MRCIVYSRCRSLLIAAAVLCWTAWPAAARAAQPLGATPLAAGPGQAPAAATDINFPPTPVGSTATLTCASECFSLNNGNNCDGSGTINVDKPLSAPFSVVNFRVTGISGCGGTPVTLPVTLNSGQRLVFDFDFAPTQNGQFTDTLDLGGITWTLNGSTTSSTTCNGSSTTMCLQNARFQVSADWQTANGNSGTASAVQLTPDTGYLWFFSASNVEVVIKVLNGCGVNNHFWVFAGGLTNVHVVIHVTDTQTGVTRNYINPQRNPFPPVQDTSAFLCP
jgi:hypothetical protein